MQALAEIVAEQGVHNFTVPDVAERAGVSLRSVYRYFPTREALLAGLYEWGDQLMDVPGVIGTPSSPDEFPDMAERLFALFDSAPLPIKAMVLATLTTNIRPESRRQRDETYREVLFQVTSNLGLQERRRAFAVLRYLFGSQAWLALTEQFGLDSSEAGKAVAWALRTLINDLKARNAGAATSGQRRDSGNE